MIIKINSTKNFDDKIVKHAADILSNEGVAILPTSTIYGLSCIYSSKKALERIYEIKKRKKGLPFIILISRLNTLKFLVEEKNKIAEKLIKYYWLSKNKTPLTLVFKKNKALNNFATDKKGKIAVRLDSLPIIKKIINICGPIISTSATISGTDRSPKNTDEISPEIKTSVDLIVDYGIDLDGIASTVLDVTESKPVIIREGRLKLEEIIKKIN